MTDPQYERFIARKPIYEVAASEVKGRQWPLMTYVSDKQIPEAGLRVDLGWIYEVPRPNLPTPEQVLDYDQLLVHIGMDPAKPQDLGATIELSLGGQLIVFNTTTAIFIPKGIPYRLPIWQEVSRPHVQLSIVLGSGDPYSVPGKKVAPEAATVGAALSERGIVSAETGGLDFEQYVVRSPIREAGPDRVEGRQNPTMTYMSGTQVPGVKHYLEIGWIWEAPNRAIPRMRHDNYDEVVVHLGSDPDHPEDLGATMRFDVGDELAEFDTTHCVFLPRELNHGPLIWKEVRRPMLEIATMLGAGTWAEGWEGSFFDES